MSNIDESRIMLNESGKYSFQPKQQSQVPARSVNDLNPKAGVTVMAPIRRDGLNDFRPIIIDAHCERSFSSALIEVSSKKNELGKRHFAFMKCNRGRFYLGLTASTYINRSLFRQYMLEYSRWLTRRGERRAVTLDNLSAHYLGQGF